ncbi:MAG: GNAT family N-acetyltransferase [Bacteroidetes bacterium]|nr:GNAT family N-acetyltransferase [Bacteroidota bacterium]
MKIIYQVEEHLNTEEFIQVLIDSTLSERRPVNDRLRIDAMVKNSNLIITARVDGKLIGVARSVSDFNFATYLSDLAVNKEFQKLGIGKELIRLTKLAAPLAKLILLAAPAAIEYYPKIGMKQHMSCFFLDEVNDLLN